MKGPVITGSLTVLPSGWRLREGNSEPNECQVRIGAVRLALVNQAPQAGDKHQVTGKPGVARRGRVPPFALTRLTVVRRHAWPSGGRRA